MIRRIHRVALIIRPILVKPQKSKFLADGLKDD